MGAVAHGGLGGGRVVGGECGRGAGGGGAGHRRQGRLERLLHLWLVVGGIGGGLGPVLLIAVVAS